MLNLLKKKTANEKTAIQITPSQKATTAVANVAGKVKTGAFGVATGAGIAGTMMLQNEKGIRNRKAREAYHKRVEQVCTVAVGAAVVGAGAAIVQGIFDPVVDVSMLEIEPETYCKLHNKASEFENAETGSEETDEHVEDEGAAEDDKAEIVHEQNAEQHVEKVVAEIVQTEQHVDPNAGKPADSASAAQTNQGDNAQQPKSDADKQKPNDSSQGASNNNPKNGNNHAKATK